MVVCGFYYLMRLFQLYAKSIIFSYQNVLFIRKAGYMLLLQVMATMCVQPLLTIILTLNAGKGEHIITIGFSGDELSTLVVGGIVVLISWIMEEGRKLGDELGLIV
jgi:hypothetical protein